MRKQQQLWRSLVGQLLTSVSFATELTVAILNTYSRVANSLSASADACNGLIY